MSGQHVSSGIFRSVFKIFFLAVLPGIWLALTFCSTAGEEPFAGNGVSGFAVMIFFAALGVAAGAAVSRRSGAQSVLAPFLAYPFFSGGVAAFLLGWFAGCQLSAERFAKYLPWSGCAFACGIILQSSCGIPDAQWEVFGYPLLAAFLLAANLRDFRWYWRLGMILLLPLSTAFFAEARLAASAEPVQTERSGAMALPASLLPPEGAERILLISDRTSALPGIWCTLPYVNEVLLLLPGGAVPQTSGWSKLQISSGAPGRMAAAADGGFDLIFVELLPPAGNDALRKFFAELISKLKPDSGVLIVPAEYAKALPGTGKQLLPPGGGGRFLACGNQTLNGNIEYLDEKLQRLQQRHDPDSRFMPRGILSALYPATPQIIPAEQPRIPEPKKIEWLRITGVAAAWLLGLLLLYRCGAETRFMGLPESGAALTLTVLAAAARLEEGVLAGGVLPLSVLGIFGLTTLPFLLQHSYPERFFVLFSGLLPLTAAGNWMLPAILPAGLMTAETIARIRREVSGCSAALTFRVALGACAGCLLFCWLGSSPESALLLALCLRLGRVIR